MRIGSVGYTHWSRAPTGAIDASFGLKWPGRIGCGWLAKTARSQRMSVRAALGRLPVPVSATTKEVRMLSWRRLDPGQAVSSRLDEVVSW
jgi:hypothetical protein